MVISRNEVFVSPPVFNLLEGFSVGFRLRLAFGVASQKAVSLQFMIFLIATQNASRILPTCCKEIAYCFLIGTEKRFLRTIRFGECAVFHSVQALPRQGL